MTTPLPFWHGSQWWDGAVQVEGKRALITANQLPSIAARKTEVGMSKGWLVFTYLCLVRLKIGIEQLKQSLCCHYAMVGVKRSANYRKELYIDE